MDAHALFTSDAPTEVKFMFRGDQLEYWCHERSANVNDRIKYINFEGCLFFLRRVTPTAATFQRTICGNRFRIRIPFKEILWIA